MKHVLALLALVFFALAPRASFAQEASQPAVAEGQEYKVAFNDARAALQSKKYQDAYNGFESALEGAIAAEDAQVEALTRGILAKLDYTFGKAKADKDNFAEAVTDFDAGIGHNPAYPHNYLGKGMALQELGQGDSAAAVLQKGIVVAQEASEGAVQSQLTTAFLNLVATDGGLLLGKSASRAATEQALARLTSADSVLATNATAKLYFSRAHTAMGNYQEAIAAADAGIALDPRDRNEKAALYFAKGEALRLAGNTDAAKNAYQLAVYGDYKDQAQYYVDTL